MAIWKYSIPCLSSEKQMTVNLVFEMGEKRSKKNKASLKLAHYFRLHMKKIKPCQKLNDNIPGFQREGMVASHF